MEPLEEVAERLRLSPTEYAEIEAGESPIEKYGSMLVGFSKIVEQPVNELLMNMEEEEEAMQA